MGEKMNLNNYLEVVGVMRGYQWTQIIVQGMLAVTYAMQLLIIVFNHPDPGFTCIDGEVLNLTTVNSTCMSAGNCTVKDDQCIATYETEDGTIATKKCENFEYSTMIFPSTVVEEFDLVCERAPFVTILNTVWMICELVGSIVGGYLCDKMGRKVPIATAMLSFGILGTIMAFSQHEIMYLVFRCVTAAVSSVGFVAVLTLLLETTAPTQRTHALNVLVMFWVLGTVLLPLLAWAIGNWRYLQLTASVIIIPPAIAAIWVVDESPHWLIVNGKKERALEVLHKIARWNRVTPPSVSANDLVATDAEILEDEKEHTEVSRENCCLIWKHCHVLSRVVIFAFGWFVVNYGYYIIQLGVGQIPGNIYINMVISAAVEAFAYVVCFAIAWAGRKLFTVGSYFSACAVQVAVVLILEFAAGKGLIAVTALSMIGKFFVSMAWQVMYFWTSEVLPTTHRATLMTIVVVLGRIGSIIVPPMLDIPKYSDAERADLVVPVLFIVLMFVAGVTHLFVPETNRCKFPATYEAANVRRFTRIDEMEDLINGEKSEMKAFLSHDNKSEAII